MASLNVARDCVASLADAGCELPSWFELVDGVRPPVPEDTGDPFQPRQGWQHFASNTVEELHLREALPTLPPPQRALVRSQGGPLSSRPFVARLHDSPSSRPSLSVCCSSVVSTCPSPCPPATAGVAVHSTALAMRGCRVAWVRHRERHRQDLPGGRRTRVNERVRAGFGSWTVQSARWPSSGGRGRWAVTVWWGPVGH